MVMGVPKNNRKKSLINTNNGKKSVTRKILQKGEMEWRIGGEARR
jgi:hypothetical protein